MTALSGVGVGIEIGAQQERAHAVAENIIGQIRVLRGNFVVQALFILDRRQPAAGEIASEAVFRGAAVAHVIVGSDDITMLRQKFRKRVIASDMLGDAVNELDDGLRLPFRLPERAVQAARATGIKIEFFHKSGAPFKSPVYGTYDLLEWRQKNMGGYF